MDIHGEPAHFIHVFLKCHKCTGLHYDMNHRYLRRMWMACKADCRVQGKYFKNDRMEGQMKSLGKKRHFLVSCQFI